MNQITKITLNVKEVSALLGLSQNTIYTMCREGEIPHVRVRNRLLFHRISIENWLRGNEQHA